MRDDRFLRAYESVTPSPAARDAMLSHILNAREEPPPASTRSRAIRRILPAACAAAVLLVVAAVPHFSAPESPSAVLQQVAPGADSPSGMRKMMNYGGFRYTFLENGATYDLSSAELSQPLGVLEYDMQQDPETYGSMDGAASFAVGGTIYELDGYDPAFRLVVEWEGQYYIVQCVDTLDGSVLELAAYFETADFQDTVKAIAICDHSGQTVLRTLSGDDAAKLLAVLSNAAPAEFTNDQYQAIAHAQNSGESYQVVLQLTDSTSYSLYVIPTLCVVSAGDNRYQLSDEYATELDAVFTGLEQAPIPMG